MRRVDHVAVHFVQLTAPAGDKDVLLERARRLLDSCELHRAAAFRLPGQARRYTLAHSCARVLLARSIGAGPAGIAFERRCAICGHPAHGKPRLSAAGKAAFNMSRAGEWLAVAISSGRELGVDIEVAERGTVAAELARSVLNPAERAAWLELPPRSRPAEFLRRWTKKEAYLKYLGTGLTVPLGQVDTVALTAAGIVAEVTAPAGCISALASDAGVTRRGFSLSANRHTAAELLA